MPSPGSRGALGRVRAITSRAFAETVPLATDGNGNGHRAATAGKDAVAVPAGDGLSASPERGR